MIAATGCSALKAGLIGFLALFAMTGAVWAQGQVKSTSGDWQMRCENPAGARTEQCALVQSVSAEDRPNINLVVIVLKTADGKSRLLRVLAPLGVLLPAGLGLKIDQTDVGRAGFVRCTANGCVAEVMMDDELIGKLKKGESATFIVFQTPEEGIGIPVSLKGTDRKFVKFNFDISGTDTPTANVSAVLLVRPTVAGADTNSATFA